MKLKLDERTLNAYINEAIRLELNENETNELFFGNRSRKQSARMITGQGWGNQKRANDNLWGAANTDISDTDANEEVPQTLVGMIKKMEQGLVSIEQLAGLPGNYEGLADKVAATKNNGRIKVNNSLLNAINALARIAQRLGAVERQSGSNAIMESVGDYADAVVGTNAAIGNARNMEKLGQRQKDYASAEQKLAAARRSAASANGRYGNAVRYKNPKVADLKKASDVARTEVQNAKQAVVGANDALKDVGISRNTGFWGKQWANMKKGAAATKRAFTNAGDTISKAKTGGKVAQNIANKAANGSKVAKVLNKTGRGVRALSGVGKVGIQGFKAALTAAQLPLILFTIADEAARQAAQGRQRNVVRTYNCAAILAKRLGNIAQEIANAQGADEDGVVQESVNELNVNRATKSFGSIETNMQALSALMKGIYANLNAAKQNTDATNTVQMPNSLNTPQEIAQFQTWANQNGFTDQNGNQLKVDGIFGVNTSYVYNQIAQRYGQGQQQAGPMMESKAVENALANLENAVGMTGSGGNAYTDISAMSGGEGASRLQNAQNAKNVMRTYPPVLNRYLEILSDAGANVQGIQPLMVDNRPHRDYSVKEIQNIDNRIKQLLSIAQSVANNMGAEQNNGAPEQQIALPQKPVQKPVSRPQRQVPAPPTPEIPVSNNAPDVSFDDLPGFEDIELELDSIPDMVAPQILQSYGIIPNNKSGRIAKHEVKQYIKNAAKQGTLSKSDAKELIKKLKSDYKSGVAQQYQNPDGSIAYTTDNARRNAAQNGQNTGATINQPMNETKTRKKINEAEFKKMVMDIVKEII